MRNFTSNLDQLFPLILSLFFIAAFLYVGDADGRFEELEAQTGLIDQSRGWSEDGTDYALLTTTAKDSAILGKNTQLSLSYPVYQATILDLISEAKKSKAGKKIASTKVTLKTEKAKPKAAKKSLVKGKSTTVNLEKNFTRILAKNSKLKSKKLKSKKSAKKTDKKSAAKDKSKYKIGSAKWQPKSRKLARVYNKAYSSGKLSKLAITKAFKYYEKYKSRHGLSDKYLVVADYTKVARDKRMHLINLKNGKISSYFVAHGKRSGPVGGRVYATSNRRNSNMTSKGFFKVGYKEGRTIKKGYKYLSVTGLERGNRKVGLPTRLGGRDVVIHTASYVNRGGRSFGCFSIRPQDRRPIFSKIKGALLYSYAG